MLRYTGHPFVDTGFAAITAFVHKQFPHEVNLEDLEQVITYIEHNYVCPPLRNYLTMAFTSNAWFTQDAYNPEKPGLSSEEQARRQATRNAWAYRHLRQWQGPSPEGIMDLGAPYESEAAYQDVCVFTGESALRSPLSSKLLPGRAQIPLAQGDDAINFLPYGHPGLPISGLALLALQFFPLACARCGVGLLAVHTDNEALLYQLTSVLLQQNMRAIIAAQAAHEERLPRLIRSPKTLLVELLVELERQRSSREEEQEPASLSAYNFNNGKAPDLVIYHLPLEIVQFLQVVATPTYKTAWERLVQRSWQMAEQARQSGGKQGRGAQTKGKGAQAWEPRSNFLYEDLFDLPAQAPRFIRTYFLRIPRHTGSPTDPRRQYSLRTDIESVQWPLFELFLERIIRMDSTRLAQIRALGDGLAIYVRRQGGKRFFRHFFTEQRPAVFRGLLIKANIAHVKDGQAALFDLDAYIEVFEEGDEVMRPDWRLARDLVLIRMIDQLKDWLAQNPDAVPEEEPASETASDEPVEAPL